MKFIVDAQLPMRISQLLQNAGYECIHTRDLPLKNATPDTEINALSLAENRIVITKDKDFLNSFLLTHQPYKLLLVTTGNITNQELEELFIKNMDQITESFKQYNLIEMSRDTLLIHI